MLHALPLLAALAATPPPVTGLPLPEVSSPLLAQEIDEGGALYDDAAEPYVEDAPSVDGDLEAGGGGPTENVPQGPPPGMDPLLTTAAQIGAGCGVALLMAPCFVLPYVNFCTGPIACLVAPAAIGSVETLVGDLLGQNRGALLWPVLAGYGGELLGLGVYTVAVVVTGLLAGGGIAGLTTVLSRDPNPSVLIPALLASYGVVILGAAVGALAGGTLCATAPALAYMFTSEPKKPGDTEFRFPGLTAPDHGTTTAMAPPTNPALAEQGMAF